MPVWLQAGPWGLPAGGALVLGAPVAWFVGVPRAVVASIMAFGAGVLISALAFDLVDEAETSGGLTPTVRLPRRRRRLRRGERRAGPLRRAAPQAVRQGATVGGASSRAAARRSRSARCSTAIPESVVLGLSLLGGGGVGVPVLAAIFISNLPEGLSSAAGMKRNGRSATYVFGVWSASRSPAGSPASSVGGGWTAPARECDRGNHRGGCRRHPGHGGRHHDPGSLRKNAPVRRPPGHHRVPRGLHHLAGRLTSPTRGRSGRAGCAATRRAAPRPAP